MVKNKDREERKKFKKERNRLLAKNHENWKIDKKDLIIMGILMAIYTIISFYHLGTFKNPQTFYNFTYSGESIGVIISGSNQEISKIRYYNGSETGSFNVLASSDGETYKEIATIKAESAFAWEDLEITKNNSIKNLKIVSTTAGSFLGEIQLYNKYGKKVAIMATDDQSVVIADESDTVPATISNINSSYFDEVYFARSAYEYVNGIDTMEWVHPPLGKLIMAIPILLFGMSTFSYRLMGCLAGIAMIPVIYVFAKRIFKNRKWASLAGILMTFDCFHFAQTRMGTVDSFLVLFIILASLFMYQYISIDKKAPLTSKMKNLFWSGLFMGLAICTKWTGLYAGLGLAIVFFVDLLYEYTDKRKKAEKDELLRKVLYLLFVLGIVPIIIYYAALYFATMSIATSLIFIYYVLAVLIAVAILIINLLKKDKSLWKLFVSCLVFFILIPLIIYLLSYLLFPNVYNYDNNSIAGIINQTKDMFGYHSTLTEGHNFQSNWYEWPAMIKPVWYYAGSLSENIRATIVGIGNPAIWWFGIIAMIYVIIESVSKKNKECLFILAFIACNWLPYIFINRAMFMYHYFPVLPFIMLAIVAFVKWITEKIKSNSFYIFYVALVILLFAIFYPVISGMFTSEDYINSIRWLSTWIF